MALLSQRVDGSLFIYFRPIYLYGKALIIYRKIGQISGRLNRLDFCAVNMTFQLRQHREIRLSSAIEICLSGLEV